MIIHGPANMTIMETKKNRITGITKRVRLFRFDENGRYETDDPKIIAKAKKRYTITESEHELPQEQAPEPVVDKAFLPHRCKKCDYVADSWGALMAHCRAEHKKPE